MSFHQIFPDIVYKTHINDSEIIKKKFADKIINKFKHDPNESFQWGGESNTWQVKANKEIQNLNSFATQGQSTIKTLFYVGGFAMAASAFIYTVMQIFPR